MKVEKKKQIVRHLNAIAVFMQFINCIKLHLFEGY